MRVDLAMGIRPLDTIGIYPPKLLQFAMEAMAGGQLYLELI